MVFGEEKLKLMQHIVKVLNVKKIYAYKFDIEEHEWIRKKLKSINSNNFKGNNLFELKSENNTYYLSHGHEDNLWVEGSTVEALVALQN